VIRHAPKSEWRRVGSGAIRVEILPNGDEVACASRWNPPDPFGGVSSEKIAAVAELVRTGAYRADTRSRDWIGYAVAEVIGIPVSYGADKIKLYHAATHIGKNEISSQSAQGLLTVECLRLTFFLTTTI